MSSDHAYLEAALPGFSEARLLIKAKGDCIHPLGFVGTKFDFYRFVNRYRLARSFEGMSLIGFTDETRQGYEALTRSFFIWSSFETYAQLANDPHLPYRKLFAHYPRRKTHELANFCRQQDPEHKLIDFLCDHARETNQEKFLTRFRDGQDFCVFTLAACMRHIFVHGNLTAHPNGLPAENLINIAQAIGDFLLQFIEDDFQRRLKFAQSTK